MIVNLPTSNNSSNSSVSKLQNSYGLFRLGSEINATCSSVCHAYDHDDVKATCIDADDDGVGEWHSATCSGTLG